jgi:hypothetical protein
MTGWIRLRQIALIAPELDATSSLIARVFGLREGFRDPHLEDHFGLQNALMPVGEQFIEVCATVRPGTQGARFLERRGAGGYMVILQADPHAELRQRVADHGIRAIAEVQKPRYHLLQLHPKDTGGPMLEIDWHEGGDTPENPWSHAAGDDWRHAIATERVSAIVAADIQSDDSASLAAHWSAILGITAEKQDDTSWRIPLDGTVLNFVKAADGRGEGLGAITLSAGDPAAVLQSARAEGLAIRGDDIDIAGLSVRLLPQTIVS